MFRVNYSIGDIGIAERKRITPKGRQTIGSVSFGFFVIINVHLSKQHWLG